MLTGVGTALVADTPRSAAGLPPTGASAPVVRPQRKPPRHRPRIRRRHRRVNLDISRLVTPAG